MTAINFNGNFSRVGISVSTFADKVHNIPNISITHVMSSLMFLYKCTCLSGIFEAVEGR
jgi:hypothetical protein